jgi:predicted nuclease with RNAse H fold
LTSLIAGIDIGADQLHCVAMNDEYVVAKTEIFTASEMSQLGDWLQEASAVAVDAPAQLSTAPHEGDLTLSPKFRSARCAEIALGRDFGSWVPWVTPTEAPDGGWIATGLAVFQALRTRGIGVVEFFPWAGYRELVRPARLPKKQTVEGVRVRVEALRAAGITERDLGMWSHDGLDALLGALIARDYMAGNARRAACGHDESAIWLPAPT